MMRPCILRRAEGCPNPTVYSTDDIDRGPESPSRLPSSLPPPGKLRLAITLGPSLGHGRSGVVFEVNVDISHSSPGVAALTTPPLVAKVSRRDMSEDLMWEVFYYDGMENLQGVVNPRYYGTFMGKLAPGFSFLRSLGRKERSSHPGKTSFGSFRRRRRGRRE